MPTDERATPFLRMVGVDQGLLAPARSWVWLLLLGLGMIVSGVLAWLVAATVVILPYDEQYLGMSRAGVVAIDPRVLLFMTHDRVTLAGAMISIGVWYALLATIPLRNGELWAQRAVLISGGVGFASFFLFLGHSYFDPLHAVVAALLFPCFVLGLRQPLEPAALRRQPIDGGDARSRAGQLGQVLLVAVGCGLTVGGVVIATVGVTTVFVPTDLSFLGTTAANLRLANAHLLPLIAHDRAGLGGALASDGLVALGAALWGYRRGARWLWWTWLLAGAPGFVAALGVHLAIGYTDLGHLAPAIAGLGAYVAGLALSYPFLCDAGRIGPRSRAPARSEAVP